MMFHKFADIPIVQIEIAEIPTLTGIYSNNARLRVRDSSTHSMNHSRPTLAIGDTFPTMKDLRLQCEKFAVDNNFKFITKQADKTRYTIKCNNVEGCTWRLYAALTRTEGSTQQVEVRTLTDQHTCLAMPDLRNKHASASFVSDIIKAKLVDQPNYRPTDVVKDLRREQGVNIGYWTAFRAKEKALDSINGSHEFAYTQLPKYCEDILRTNPGSTVSLDRTSEGRFRRMFLSYAASGMGFAHCRPVLGLDGAHLKAKYAGVLLTATAVDANDRLFPVAYAVVDAENDINWAWFVELLQTVIQIHSPAHLEVSKLAFLSDIQKGLLEAVDRVFPGNPHGYCMRHLHENFHKKFPNKLLKNLLYRAAKATTETEFNGLIQEMRDINLQSVQWLLQEANPQHWAECYFPGQRYGHITSNIAESLNSWLAEAREKPILAMFEQIRHQLMKWFMDRRNIDVNINGILVTRVANTIKSLISNYARTYRILAANDDVYEIFSPQAGKNYVVNIPAKTCTCYRWQKSGIPCAHALSISLSRKEQPETYTQHFYHLDAYRATYANAIFPLNTDDATITYTV